MSLARTYPDRYGRENHRTFDVLEPYATFSWVFTPIVEFVLSTVLRTARTM